MLMRLLSRYWLLVPLLLLAIVVRDWVEQAPVVDNIEETIDMAATRADYYLEQFQTRKFDANGAVEYEITGDSLAHYPEDDRSEIALPSVTLHRPEVRWVIESARGDFHQQTDTFTLRGDVVVRREAGNGEPVLIRTNSLSILTEANEVQTDQPIEIIASSWRLESVGLQSSIDAGKLNLLSGVTGHYEINAAADK